jgi:hypothetical protein
VPVHERPVAERLALGRSERPGGDHGLAHAAASSARGQLGGVVLHPADRVEPDAVGGEGGVRRLEDGGDAQDMVEAHRRARGYPSLAGRNS